eukprot:2992520-Prymnesium_polylepis.2
MGDCKAIVATFARIKQRMKGSNHGASMRSMAERRGSCATVKKQETAAWRRWHARGWHTRPRCLAWTERANGRLWSCCNSGRHRDSAASRPSRLIHEGGAARTPRAGHPASQGRWTAGGLHSKRRRTAEH